MLSTPVLSAPALNREEPQKRELSKVSGRTRNSPRKDIENTIHYPPRGFSQTHRNTQRALLPVSALRREPRSGRSIHSALFMWLMAHLTCRSYPESPHSSSATASKVSLRWIDRPSERTLKVGVTRSGQMSTDDESLTMKTGTSVLSYFAQWLT